MGKKEGSQDAATALEALILDWPFDFIAIQGSTPEEIEENKFKWAVNMTARVERLRDFVGLEHANLLRQRRAGSPRQRRCRSGCNST